MTINLKITYLIKNREKFTGCMGDQLGVPVPTMKGMAAITCAATRIDYWNKGLTMKKLGLADKTVEEINEYVNTGK